MITMATQKAQYLPKAYTELPPIHQPMQIAQNVTICQQEAFEFYKKLVVPNETVNKQENQPQRRQLFNIVRQYLSLVDPSVKFHYREIGNLLLKSIDGADFTLDRLDEVQETFENLEKYAILLILYPWKPEYWKLKLYSGYLRVNVLSRLENAKLVFQTMGYTQSESGDRLELHCSPNQASWMRLAFDLYLCNAECDLVKEFYRIMEIDGFALSDVLKSRFDISGGLDQVEAWLKLNCKPVRPKVRKKQNLEKDKNMSKYPYENVSVNEPVRTAKLVDIPQSLSTDPVPPLKHNDYVPMPCRNVHPDSLYPRTSTLMNNSQPILQTNMDCSEPLPQHMPSPYQTQPVNFELPQPVMASSNVPQQYSQPQHLGAYTNTNYEPALNDLHMYGQAGWTQPSSTTTNYNMPTPGPGSTPTNYNMPGPGPGSAPTNYNMPTPGPGSTPTNYNMPAPGPGSTLSNYNMPVPGPGFVLPPVNPWPDPASRTTDMPQPSVISQHTQAAPSAHEFPMPGLQWTGITNYPTTSHPNPAMQTAQPEQFVQEGAYIPLSSTTHYPPLPQPELHRPGFPADVHTRLPVYSKRTLPETPIASSGYTRRPVPDLPAYSPNAPDNMGVGSAYPNPALDTRLGRASDYPQRTMDEHLEASLQQLNLGNRDRNINPKTGLPWASTSTNVMREPQMMAHNVAPVHSAIPARKETWQIVQDTWLEGSRDATDSKPPIRAEVSVQHDPPSRSNIHRPEHPAASRTRSSNLMHEHTTAARSKSNKIPVEHQTAARSSSHNPPQNDPRSRSQNDPNSSRSRNQPGSSQADPLGHSWSSRTKNADRGGLNLSEDVSMDGFPPIPIDSLSLSETNTPYSSDMSPLDDGRLDIHHEPYVSGLTSSYFDASCGGVSSYPTEASGCDDELSVLQDVSWFCQYCTFKNSQCDSVCQMCFKSRSGGVDLKPQVYSKLCQHCSAENKERARICHVCHWTLNSCHTVV